MGRIGYFLRGSQSKLWYSKEHLCNRNGGLQTCQKLHEACQANTPVTENAFEKWVLKMRAQGFLKTGYIQGNGREANTKGGRQQFRSYLAPRVSQPMYRTTSMPYTNCGPPACICNALESMKGYFQSLRDVVIWYKVKEENM